MDKILLAGDGFLTEAVLTKALLKELPNAEIRSITSTWPKTPFTDFGGVHEACGDEDELIAALKGCSVCFTHTWPITRKVIEASPDLKLVTICRGGPVNVDIAAAHEHGITVTFTPGRNAVSTAEHTIAMMLAAMRRIPELNQELHNGLWRSDYYQYDVVGPEMRGSRVGVVGYGAVGARVSHILKEMGATVRIFDPWIDPDKIENGIERVSELNALCSGSDILTIHARATADNTHMVGRKQIELLPKGAIVVNCARGSLLDYDAIVDGLKNNALYAAAFDCLPQEPLPVDHPLMKDPRVVMTPHLGGASKQAAEYAARVGSQDIAAFLNGRQPQFIFKTDEK